MAVVDGSGLPLTMHAANASTHEVNLVEETLGPCFVPSESERFGKRLSLQLRPTPRGVPREGYRDYRAAPEQQEEKSQDKRKLGCYKRSWKVGRLFA
jgi:hypothetical protein